MKEIIINHHKIGNTHPIFIIAEAGINHNGSLTLAKKMVDIAKRAGVSCIKFQTHIADKEMIKTNIRPGKISKKTLWSIIKNCELSETEELKLQKYCKKEKILFLSTPFSIEAVHRLEKLKIPAYKIGSGELTNPPFLETVAKTGKPIILSTGMSTISEIKSAVKILKKYKNSFALLQTTSTYPSDYSEIKLGMIKKLQHMFNVPVGLSDHSIGIYTAIASVAKGATIVEKHFTLDKKMSGPDQKISLDPLELKELVIGCNAVKQALGDSKLILKNEKPIRKFAEASIVTIQAIEKGEKFTLENIGTKRPGTGHLHANQFNKILGNNAKKSIESNKQLTWKDIV
jgi:sialic acid synthase SpsE